jgi:sirohydrochlorin cobaltochelatase
MSTALPRQAPETRSFGADKRHGLLLVGHGTRDTRGLAEFHTLAKLVADTAHNFDVESCFLELAEPDIAAGVRRLLDRGIERLTVAPLLLFAAGHAKRDIPEAVERAVGSPAAAGKLRSEVGVSDELQSKDLIYAPALSCHEKIFELSQQRFDEALAGRELVGQSETLLILVARGSSHADAIADMQRFTELRANRSGIAAKCCFAAVAQPTLDETFNWAARCEYRRIIVQPHLLFAGQVLDQIHHAVEHISHAGAGNKEWIVTSHLGPSTLVAEAVLDLARRNADNA